MNSLIDALNQIIATPADEYTIKGDTFNLLRRLIVALWRGENIGQSATVSRTANGPAGILLNAKGGGPSAPPGSYPWRIYNTTKTTTGQVQVNGGDEQVAQLNGFICNVNGSPSDTKTGMPLAYPQLAVTGNGYIYAYAVPTTPGTASPLMSLDLNYQGTAQSQDTANPAGYYWMLVATISNYTTDGSGNVSFDVNNAYGSGYGPGTLMYCGGIFYTF